VSDAWRLQQAISALHGGIRSLRETDADLAVDINEALPDEAADVQAAIVGVLRSAREAESLEDAAAAMEKDIGERKSRFKARKERLRGIAFAAMDALSIKKLELPDMTVSIEAGRKALQITEESKIPDEYWRTPDKVLDRTALTEDLKLGVIVEGAVLDNGLPHLKIRSR
jgi:hypothetical protein